MFCCLGSEGTKAIKGIYSLLIIIYLQSGGKEFPKLLGRFPKFKRTLIALEEHYVNSIFELPQSQLWRHI